MDEYKDIDIDSTLWIRTPSSKMEGKFVLYQTDKSHMDLSLTVAIRDIESLNATLRVRVPEKSEINSTLKVMYRVNDEQLTGTFDVVGSTYLDSTMEVRVNNRMFGKFELLPAPRIDKLISSTEDSTTRGKEDLMTINYGDSKRMMISDGEEHLESFVKFGNLEAQFKDMSILELAKLRLYYTGGFIDGINVQVHLPETKWSEYGITHANKPSSAEFISDEYTINRDEKYIEFDAMSLLKRWLSGELTNLGLIIKSNSTEAQSFNTRETAFVPSLHVKYITNQVSSLGRAELESSMFVWGVNRPEDDLRATLEVHSDYGFDYQLFGHLYVHRYEVPLYEEFNSLLNVTKPDQHSKLSVAVRVHDDSFVGRIGVWGIGGKDGEKQAKMNVSKPDIHAWLTVDPDMTLESWLVVRRTVEDDIDNQLISTLTVSRDTILGHLFVRARADLDSTLTVQQNQEAPLFSYLAVTREAIHGHLFVRERSDLNSTLKVQRHDEEPLFSYMSVTRPEIRGKLAVKVQRNDDSFHGTINVWAHEHLNSTLSVTREAIHGFLNVGRIWADDSIDATIEVPHYEELSATLSVTREEVHGFITVHHFDNLESNLWVKEREYIDGTFMVHVISEMSAFLDVIHVTEKTGKLSVSKPDIWAYFYPRVVGDSDLVAEYLVRQRDASDLHAILMVGGALGAYYYII